MKLSELAKDLFDVKKDIEVKAVWDDSRRVTPGSLFAAMPGPVVQGSDFIQDAIAKGASAVLAAPSVVEALSGTYPSVIFISVDDPKAVFRSVAERFYGYPSKNVNVIGVTGTNGKTTITYFLEAILAAAGRMSGVVGTVNYRIGGRVIPSKNTTPGCLDNQIFLSGLVKENIPCAVMEVSSHALDQGRVDLIDFKGAIFTNLTGDHLDYHKTMENYFAAKSRLFRGLAKTSYAVINTDDVWGRKLLLLTRARAVTYAIDVEADVRAYIKEFSLKGAKFEIKFSGGSIDIDTCFTGKHNVYNILAAFASCLSEGIAPEVIKKGIESLKNVPGRLERIDVGQPFSVFIDYAHTDDGLRNVLEALQKVPHKKLIVVFGAGGDRDKTKRPRMGEVASKLADLAIVTSDNPRNEKPETIIQDIIAGFTQKNYEILVDRTDAIHRALALAEPWDIVLLAGKGHETYQVLKDGEVDFVERDIVMRALCSR